MVSARLHVLKVRARVPIWPAVSGPTVDKTPAAPARGLGPEASQAFLRQISHELRTPLNAIIGFSDLIREELYGPLGSPHYGEYAAFISSSGHRMLKLVNQIVEIVRLETGADELDCRPEPLGPLAAEVLEGLAGEAHDWGVQATAEEPEAMPWVLADARALNTALTNLVHNALAHAPEGDTVIVRARRDGERVIVEVQDRGPGVDPDDAGRLLQPFEKGEPGLARDGEGAGLGLSIAQLLVRAMGGDLEIRTARGAGFTAVIALPAA